jgi:hypothetical protein
LIKYPLSKTSSIINKTKNATNETANKICKTKRIVPNFADLLPSALTYVPAIFPSVYVLTKGINASQAEGNPIFLPIL